MSDDPVYGLVCAGGGAHGAYQVGVLKYIHEHFSEGDQSPFQVFSGTSCGNLNTTFFAATSHDAKKSRLWLEELWLDFDVPAWRGSMLKNAILSFLRRWTAHGETAAACWSLLDPTPLRDITNTGFQRDGIETAFQRGSTLGVSISATEVRSGKLCFFLEGAQARSWNFFHSTGLIDRIGPPHIQASCTVPIALPPVKIGEHYFVDGGVANRRPISPAYSLGATRILTVATEKHQPTDLPKYPADFKPTVGGVLGMLVDQLAHDYATDNAFIAELLNFFYARAPEAIGSQTGRAGATYDGDQLAIEAYHPVEILSFMPSKRIRHTEIYEHEFLDETPSKGTTFMFQRLFAKKLIDFGYEDARNKHSELEAFFRRDRPQDSKAYSQFVRWEC